MIPSYLKEIANDVKVKNDSTKFTLKCRCGCEDFYLFKKERSKEDKKNESIMLKYLVKKISKKNKIEEIDGKLYYVKKNIFGKITKEEVEVPNVKLFKNYISAKCDLCGNEYVLFDENIHGYDSVYLKEESMNIDKKYNKEKAEIKIEVFYNEELDEEEIEDKSIAFGRIKINKIVNKSKKVFFDFECE